MHAHHLLQHPLLLSLRVSSDAARSHELEQRDPGWCVGPHSILVVLPRLAQISWPQARDIVCMISIVWIEHVMYVGEMRLHTIPR